MSTDVGRAAAPARTTAAQRWVLVLASIGAFMVALDALVVSTALSTIRKDLGASVTDLEWTVNAYSLSFAVLLMTGAALGERFGRRRLFVTGLALFTAASAACATAHDVSWLIASRAVQGAGAALVMPLAMTLLGAAFPGAQRARALGLFSGVAGLAVLSGPLIGGAVTQGLAWQWIFWLNVPIGVLAIPLVLAKIDRGTVSKFRLDLGGVALTSASAFGLVWALVRANQAGWGSPEVDGSLVGGLLLAALFVLWELRAPAPMLPMRFFRTRPFAAGNTSGTFLYAALYGAVFFIAQFLQVGLGYSPLGAGLRLLPWTATVSVVAPTIGARVNRYGERRFLVVGLMLQAAGMGWIALIAKPGLAYPQLIAPLLVAGCGVSIAMPAAQNAVMGAVPPPAIGQASGTFNMLRQLGGAFGVAALVAVFSASGSYTSAKAFSDGFGPAIGTAAALSFVGALVGLGVRGRQKDAPSRAGAEAQAQPAQTPAPVR